jgi:uncharacterized protein YjiS (DUF1127 family)
MTYVHTEARQNFGQVSSWFSGLFDEMKANAKRYQCYRATLNELKAMSSRELDDIGISPLSIRDVAREAARMAA